MTCSCSAFRAAGGGGVEQSLIQRTRRGRVDHGGRTRVGPDGPLVSMWSVRGAPHAHRVTQMDTIRDALAPLEGPRTAGPHVRRGRSRRWPTLSVRWSQSPTTKAEGEPPGLPPRVVENWCPGVPDAQADHVGDGLFRAAGRQAQVVLGPEHHRATVLHPRSAAPASSDVDRPAGGDAHRLLPVERANQGQDPVPGLDGGRRKKAIGEVWGEVQRRPGLGPRRRQALRPARVAGGRWYGGAPKPKGVVLVPPHDPYLRQADRTLLVPDGRRRQQVWKALAAPGALLVDGEVAGTWRYRRTERKLTVTTFSPLAPGQRALAEESARLLAGTSGSRSRR